jgi:3'-phosphoadenosine 5'-phosphosulfate sulfotransferase (PAPS reductase)/FAD synthetase
MKEALDIIDQAVETHQIKEVWGLFSGGHDSLISTHLASQHPLFKGVLHINTGIGIKDTRRFVIETCKRYQWPLHIYSARFVTKADGTVMNYRSLVLKYGFPGPAQHTMMYTWLKERQIDRFVRDRREKLGKQGFRIGLVSGVRTHESRRRTINMSKIVDGCMRDGSRVWLSPVGSWDDCKCEQYIKAAALPRNPVKDNICKSGECLCGAFAVKNELAELDVFYPETATEIRALETEVKAAGFPWGWEEQPPKWWGEKKRREKAEENGQLTLFPLCTSCQQLSEV